MTPQQLEEIITELDWTQRKAAIQFLVSPMTVYNWLNGKTPIHPHTAAYIEKVYDCQLRPRTLSESD